MTASLAQLKETLLNLTENINKQINRNAFDVAVVLLEKQLNLIVEIVSLSKEKDELRLYLREMIVRYHNMREKVNNERNLVKNSLENLSSVKKYFSSDA